MRKFLTAFAALAAGFAAQSAAASDSMGAPEPLSPLSQGADAPSGTVQSDGLVTVRNDAGDQFAFVLKRSAETGFLVAQHQSHTSHESHSSHSSHSSHRSHYSGR